MMFGCLFDEIKIL